MNQAAMRITASLLLWYLLSTMIMSGGGWGVWGVAHQGPGTSHSSPHSSSLLVGVITMRTSLYLWNIIAWLVSTQVLFHRGLIVLLFHSWMPWLACYLYLVSVCRPVCLFFCMCISFTTQLLLQEGSSSPFTVSIVIGFCKAAGKQWANEETLNRLLEALCTLQAEWSHCK